MKSIHWSKAFQCPEEVLAMKRSGKLVNVSMEIEGCLQFLNEATHRVLYVEHPDPEQREPKLPFRFYVWPELTDEICKDYFNKYKALYGGDSLDEALAVLNAS